MLLLVHSSPTTLASYRSDHLGVLCSPRRVYRDELEGWPWAADNDAYSAWDRGRYLKMLDEIEGREGCLFVTSPDVVGNAQQTLSYFFAWHDELASRGLRIALVAQDGLEIEQVPWDLIQALFIGGTDLFKMGEQAAGLATYAKALGKWLHMGRVNGHRRIRYAKALGCDSVDGTSMTWFKDAYLREFLNHAAQPRQELLR